MWATAPSEGTRHDYVRDQAPGTGRVFKTKEFRNCHGSVVYSCKLKSGETGLTCDVWRRRGSFWRGPPMTGPGRFHCGGKGWPSGTSFEKTVVATAPMGWSRTARRIKGRSVRLFQLSGEVTIRTNREGPGWKRDRQEKHLSAGHHQALLGQTFLKYLLGVNTNHKSEVLWYNICNPFTKTYSGNRWRDFEICWRLAKV